MTVTVMAASQGRTDQARGGCPQSNALHLCVTRTSELSNSSIRTMGQTGLGSTTEGTSSAKGRHNRKKECPLKE